MGFLHDADAREYIAGSKWTAIISHSSTVGDIVIVQRRSHSNRGTRRQKCLHSDCSESVQLLAATHSRVLCCHITSSSGARPLVCRHNDVEPRRFILGFRPLGCRLPLCPASGSKANARGEPCGRLAAQDRPPTTNPRYVSF